MSEEQNVMNNEHVVESINPLVASFDPQNFPLFDPQNLPQFDLQNFPQFYPQNLPQFNPQNLPSFDSQNLPPFDLENFPLFDHQNLSQFDLQNLQSFESEDFPSFQYNQFTYISRLNIIKDPLSRFVRQLNDISSNSRITLIKFSNITDIITDNILEEINNLQSRGGTDFIQMIDKFKKELDKIDSEYQPFLFILTDGQHNVGGNIEELLGDDTINGKFNMCLGIGSEDEIESRLLKKLSGFRDDTYYVSSDQDEIYDIINGACLEGLYSKINNVKFTLVFKNEDIIITGEKTREYLDKEELNEYLKDINIVSEKIICENLDSNNYLLKPLDVNTKISEKKMHFFICVDISGSMSETIHKKEKYYKKHQKIEKQDKEFVKIEIEEISNYTDNTNIIFNGKLVSVIVEYKFNDNIVKELIEVKLDSEYTFNKKINEYITILDELNKINELSDQSEIKDRIQKLHNDNLNFVLNIDDLDIWFVQQAKTLWEQVIIRFKRTLSRGEQFINFDHITPATLCRVVTATTDNTYPELTRYRTNNTQLCKICYTNPIEVVFTNCRHAGVCLNCIKEHIDLNGNKLNGYECPFCKSRVDSFVKLTTDKPICDCGNTVSYYGKCTHPIACKNCIKKSEYCKICDKNVEIMKVYYC